MVVVSRPLEFERNSTSLFEMHFIIKFFLKFSRPSILKSCSALTDALVSWDLQCGPEMEVKLEVLLNVEFDYTKSVPTNLE